MSIVTDGKATMTVIETTIKTEKVERVVQTENAKETEAVGFIETEKEVGIENEIDTNLEEDQEVAVQDGRRTKGRVVTEIDIEMTIETVIGIGFSEWF